MKTLQKDINSKLLKTYLPPFKGVWNTLPPYLIPDDAVQEGFNTTLLGGKLRSRLGLKSYNRDSFNGPILGSFLTVDTDNNKYPIVSTRNKVYQYINKAWKDITGITILTADDTNRVRMSSLQLGKFVFILYANGIDAIKYISQAEYQLFNITPHDGDLPVLTDVCTSFSRFVGITPPYTVTWCDNINDSYLSFTNWPPLNQAILADTEDSLIAIRSLGTLGLAIYKEGNIFTGFAQSGANSQAFRFEHRGEYEGPAGVNAVVNVNGKHMYMTPTGRIAIFDGTSHNFIGDGIWPYLQDDLATEYAYKIFGVYNYKTAEVYFWYPRVQDNGLCKGMIIINTPFPQAGVTDYAYFTGESNFECTNGLSIRLFESTTSPLIFGDQNETFILDKDTYSDNHYSFNCRLKPGLFRPGNSEENEDIYRPTIELYSSRDKSRGTVDVSGVVSNTLENSGIVTKAEEVDLTETPINEFIGFNETGSFLGVEFEWNSESRFEYKGCDIYGRTTI